MDARIPFQKTKNSAGPVSIFHDLILKRVEAFKLTFVSDEAAESNVN